MNRPGGTPCNKCIFLAWRCENYNSIAFRWVRFLPTRFEAVVENNILEGLVPPALAEVLVTSS